MNLFPRFTNRRRVLQLGRYGLRHGTKVFDKLNKTNLFLANQFSKVEILCNVCGKKAGLWYEMHSIKEKREHRVGLLRETLECLNCLSRMRYRIMAYGLLSECRNRFNVDVTSVAELAPKLQNIDILDTDSFSPAARILSGSSSYKMSIYMPDRPFGFIQDLKLYNIDLQAMVFPDKTFDIILSSDVMEHVKDFRLANSEILRCLKPGGTHIFTVPFDEPPMFTRTMIDTGSSQEIYLEPPQIHGDDHLTGGIPAYRIFGMDILDDLTTFGFEAKTVRVSASANGIFDGQYFIARRPLEAK
jgi:SAM-dependent methyltransferase